jgi:hypothetical protein
MKGELDGREKFTEAEIEEIAGRLNFEKLGA